MKMARLKKQRTTLWDKDKFFTKFQPLKMPLENLFHNLNMAVAGHLQSVLGILSLL